MPLLISFPLQQSYHYSHYFSIYGEMNKQIKYLNSSETSVSNKIY